MTKKNVSLLLLLLLLKWQTEKNYGMETDLTVTNGNVGVSIMSVLCSVLAREREREK